jgi:hypothetical protein
VFTQNFFTENAIHRQNCTSFDPKCYHIQRKQWQAIFKHVSICRTDSKTARLFRENKRGLMNKHLTGFRPSPRLQQHESDNFFTIAQRLHFVQAKSEKVASPGVILMIYAA